MPLEKKKKSYETYFLSFAWDVQNNGQFQSWRYLTGDVTVAFSVWNIQKLEDLVLDVQDLSC